MTTSVSNKTTKYTPNSYNGEKPFNDIPCANGEVLAPFVVTDDTMIKVLAINRDNMKTVRLKNGRTVPVAYTPVAIEHFYGALSAYFKDINAYLNRYDTGKLEVFSFDELSSKGKISRLKLEKHPNDETQDKMIFEEINYKPAATTSHEEKIMMMEAIEELIDIVYQRNEKYGKILKLIYQDITISKQEIIEKLGMKKTQGYEAIKKAHALAKEVYKELNQ